jgi:hypothetical protein
MVDDSTNTITVQIECIYHDMPDKHGELEPQIQQMPANSRLASKTYSKNIRGHVSTKQDTIY